MELRLVMANLPETRQTVIDYSEARDAYKIPTENGLEDFMAMKSDIIFHRVFINNWSPQFGTGSPEGVVTCNNSQVYYDTSVTPVIMYINQTIGADTGWQEVQ